MPKHRITLRTAPGDKRILERDNRDGGVAEEFIRSRNCVLCVGGSLEALHFQVEIVLSYLLRNDY